MKDWPNTEFAYEFAPAGAAAELAVSWTFGARSYQPAAGRDFAATQRQARADAGSAAEAYSQLRTPGTRVALATSIAALDGDPQARSSALELSLQDYLGSAFVYLCAAQMLREVSVPTGGKTLAAIGDDFGSAAGTLAQANASAEPVALFASPTLSIPQYYRVHVGDTLSAIAAALLPDSTPAERLALIEQIATANAALPLRSGTALSLPNYVLQPDDTLTSVAANVGPRSSRNQPAAVRLLLDNADVADVFPAGTTLFHGLTTYAAQPGDTLQTVADGFAITVDDLGARNALAALAAGQTLAIPYLVDTRDVATSTYRADGSETLAGIVAKFAAWQSDPSAGLTAFVTLNRYVPALFETTTAIDIGNAKVTPTTASTFDLLAIEFGLDVQTFAAAIAGQAGRVRKDATVYAVALTAVAGETFAGAAARYNATVTELADANASVYGLIAPGAKVSAGGYQATVGSADTFTSLAARINAARTAASPPLPPTVTPADVAGGVWSPALNLNAATLLPPVRGARATAAVTPLYAAPIAPVHVTASLSRDTDLGDPELNTSATVWTSAMPLTAKPFAPDALGDDPPFSLRAFAAQFEAAFPGFKLATATAAPAAAGDPDPLSNRQLWAVNLGRNGAVSARFNYTVDRADVQFFAIPPLATSLWDSGDLTVRNYVSGIGLTGGVVRRFRLAEPDRWASTFMAALDGLLAPEVAVALYRFDPAAFATIAAAKNTLASAIKTELVPVFALPQGATATDTSLRSAQEALYQQLLVELGAAYATNVLVQFPFTVASACGDADVAARLSGKPFAAVYRTAASGAVGPADVAAALGVSLTYVVGSGAPPAGGVVSATPFLVQPGLPTSFYGKSYTTTNADTLDSLAAAYAQLLGHAVTVLELVSGIDTGGLGLLRNGAAINVTRTTRPVLPNASLTSIADSCGGTVIELARANSERKNVFVPGSALALPGLPAGAVPADGSFASVAQALGTDLIDLATALWTADVTAAGGYTLDTSANTVLTVLRVPPPYTFSTAKLPLAAGEQYATFLFDAKDAALNRAVFLDLDYAITDMEYDIVEDRNALGASQASSWLSFVLPIEKPDPALFPNDGYLGPVQIPLPLRAYPEAFALADPMATYSGNAPGAGADTVFEWSYEFGAIRTMAAQDSAELHVAFNVPDGASSPAPMVLATRTALFGALAAFADIYPAVAEDLDQLRQPTPNTPVLSGALSAFTTLMNGIVTAWNAKTVDLFATAGGGDLYRFTLQTLVDETTQNEYAYLLLDALEGPRDFAFTVPSSCAADLIAGKLDPVRQPFAAAGYLLSHCARLRQPYSAPWTIVDAENTFTLTPGTAAIVVARAFLWPAIGTPDTPALPARQLGASMLYTFAQKVDQPAQLHFGFPRVQVIGKQNALAGLAVTRNAGLVASRQTAEAFVYQTPMTSFPNPTNPYKIVSAQVDLTEYLRGKAGLANALSGFFDTVFASQIAAGTGGTRQIALTAEYAYEVTEVPGGGQPLVVKLPLALVPQYDYAVLSGTTFLAEFASFVEEQAKQAGIASSTGWYGFEFTVYSSLGTGTANRPLLTFENLVYPLTGR